MDYILLRLRLLKLSFFSPLNVSVLILKLFFSLVNEKFFNRPLATKVLLPKIYNIEKGGGALTIYADVLVALNILITYILTYTILRLNCIFFASRLSMWIQVLRGVSKKSSHMLFSHMTAYLLFVKCFNYRSHYLSLIPNHIVNHVHPV